MQAIKICTALACSLLLAACATQAVKPSLASPVPPDRISNETILSTNAGQETSAATFVRDSGIYGIGETIYLYIDGQEIAGFRPSEKLTIYVPKGEHLLGVQSRPNFGLEQFIESPTNFIGGREYSFRISIDGSKAIVQRTSAF